MRPKYDENFWGFPPAEKPCNFQVQNYLSWDMDDRDSLNNLFRIYAFTKGDCTQMSNAAFSVVRLARMGHVMTNQELVVAGCTSIPP